LLIGVHGDPDNLESLHNKREQRDRKATHEYIQMLLETVDKGPQELGYALVDGQRD